MALRRTDIRGHRVVAARMPIEPPFMCCDVPGSMSAAAIIDGPAIQQHSSPPPVPPPHRTLAMVRGGTAVWHHHRIHHTASPSHGWAPQSATMPHTSPRTTPSHPLVNLLWMQLTTERLTLCDNKAPKMLPPIWHQITTVRTLTTWSGRDTPRSLVPGIAHMPPATPTPAVGPPHETYAPH